MKKRYRILRIIGKIYKVLGIIAAVITVLATISICAFSALGSAAMSRYTRGLSGIPPRTTLGGVLAVLITGLLVLLYGGAITISLYGLGEGIDLLISLEENTRKTAQLLDKSETMDE